MMDLFTYPQSPGFKARETSQAAAESMRDNAAGLRARVLAALKDGAMTADECATLMRCDKLAVRPRFSELAARGQIRDTGRRRANASGKSAIVWGLA